jgi:hypothetical protein
MAANRRCAERAGQRASPVDAETIHGRERVAPVVFQQFGAAENEGGSDALASGKLADVGFVGRDRADLDAALCPPRSCIETDEISSLISSASASLR